MYTKNDLTWIYFGQSDDGRLSPRLPDYRKIFTLKTLNYSLNTCEKWDNFLDIGASSGHYSKALLSKFKKGTGIEIDQNKNLEKVATNNNNFTVNYGYFEDALSQEKFDFVTLIDVFEHFPTEKINLITEKISSLQDSGGVIYLLTPNPIICGPAKESELFYQKEGRLHHGHYKHYTEQEVLNLFSPYNYKKIFTFYHKSLGSRWAERILFSLSIRDRKLLNDKFYRLISSPFFLLARIFFKSYFYLLYLQDWQGRYSETNGEALIIALKKLQ